MDNKELKVGDYVHYSPDFGKNENGRVKSIRVDVIFIVFNCNNEWDNFMEYTGQNTPISYVGKGWVDEQGNYIKTPDDKRENETCDHHYIPTNAKW